MPNKKINKKIIQIWRQFFKSNLTYAPLFYDDFKKGGLLFVGYNPSFPNRNWIFLKQTEYEKISPKTFFKWKNISKNPKLIRDCINIEKYAQQNYLSYFRRIQMIANNSNLFWQHIDLFLRRETSQNKKYIMNGRKLNDFGEAQFRLFEEILKTILPKCIIIINALSSKIIREKFIKNLEWSESKGYHFLKISNKKVPIFFSSMLSGKRALDTGSYERLLWQIKQATKKR